MTPPERHSDATDEVTVYVVVTHGNRFVGVYGSREEAEVWARDDPGRCVEVEQVEVER